MRDTKRAERCGGDGILDDTPTIGVETPCPGCRDCNPKPYMEARDTRWQAAVKAFIELDEQLSIAIGDEINMLTGRVLEARNALRTGSLEDLEKALRIEVE